MPRPRNREDLLKAADENYEKMNQLIDSLSETEWNTPFDFSKDEKKKEAHWKRDKNVRDVLVHLYEWHQLMIRFVDENSSGNHMPFLPKLYTWRTIASMNQMFWKKHQGTSLEEARRLLGGSHAEVLKRIRSFSNEGLFLIKAFPAVGGTTLGSYFVSSTSSHYDWAIKKIKAHQKNCRNMQGK
ncbi:ClbS/DfsB family four-helix bundle protein [Lacrimispora sp. 210928-DFI.3.58]|uniref:ClbS/DfsB family four-helix bundle protein n=1 Tax=Lacrimispora sp. 210928-DFI.3.58 TaxID=2883214 RepID=UPI0015B4AFD1|nr:ClbS/DfsB family four-helix bundle protein [Lacrimispora sp. 210928-DFI.3.58]MCB7321244.1 ClbS/DfsB family four-helix bundle protein [Lacrimispora sp. 210928-DFI.3.58]